MTEKFKTPHIHLLYSPEQSIHNPHPLITKVNGEENALLYAIQKHICRFSDAVTHDYNYTELKKGYDLVIGRNLAGEIEFGKHNINVYAPEEHWQKLGYAKKNADIYIIAPRDIYPDCFDFIEREGNDRHTPGMKGRTFFSNAVHAEEINAAGGVGFNRLKGWFDSANGSFYFTDEFMFKAMRMTITHFENRILCEKEEKHPIKPGNIRKPHP